MRFKDTAVGRLLYIYAPIEYRLLKEYSSILRKTIKSGRITVDILNTIAYNSENPIFHSVRFQKAMILFKRFGYRPLVSAKWNKRDAVYFAKYSYPIHETMKKCTE